MTSKALTNGASGKDNVKAGNPNQSLYLNNLNDKINKNELKRALYMLFSTYGPVLDIVTTRKSSNGKPMRGQAHIVYRDIATSTQAMRALQGFDLFGKEMRIVYGKGESHIIGKLRGTFAPAQVPGASTSAETAIPQKSIFSAPPPGIPTKPTENGTSTSTGAEKAPQGLKRPRDEEDEEDDQDEASMEEDEDDAPMEEDDDD